MKFHRDTYLLRCFRYREKHVKDVCCCLQKYNSVVYVVYSDGVNKFDGHIYHGYPVICKSISHLKCIMGVYCCCLHTNYIVYKDFDRSLHVRSSDPTCVQNFRLVPLTIFEILRFKLKNKNDKKKKKKKNWRNRLFAISPILVV